MSGFQSYLHEVVAKNMQNEAFVSSFSAELQTLYRQYTAVDIVKFLANNLSDLYLRERMTPENLAVRDALERFVATVAESDKSKYDQVFSSLVHLILQDVKFEGPTFAFPEIAEYIKFKYSDEDFKIHALLIDLVLTFDLTHFFEEVLKTPEGQLTQLFSERGDWEKIVGGGARNRELRAGFAREILILMVSKLPSFVVVADYVKTHEAEIKQGIREMLVFVKYFQNLEKSTLRRHLLICGIVALVFACILAVLYGSVLIFF